jgi:hydrogenase maturation protein HypF
MACAWLQDALGTEPALPRALRGAVDPRRWRDVARLARSDLAPVTTSAGRLFDAVAALCGGPPRCSYEGQAAIELEARCAGGDRGRYDLPVRAGADGVVLDPRPAILGVAADVDAGVPAATVAARFHAALAGATARACALVAAARGLDTVVLSGGVLQNRRLAEATAAALRDDGLRVLLHRLVPPNDGGISFGQAAVAACATAEG